MPRNVFQIIPVVLGKSFQDIRLAVEQATSWILCCWPSSLKVNAMEGKLGFQLLDLRGRSRRRRRFHVHYGGGRGGERRIAVIVHVASERDMAGACVPGIQCGAVTGA